MEIPPQQLLPCFQDPRIVDVTDRLGIEDADQRTMVDSNIEIWTAQSVVLELVQTPVNPESLSFNGGVIGLGWIAVPRPYPANQPAPITTRQTDSSTRTGLLPQNSTQPNVRPIC